MKIYTKEMKEIQKILYDLFRSNEINILDFKQLMSLSVIYHNYKMNFDCFYDLYNTSIERKDDIFYKESEYTSKLITHSSFNGLYKLEDGHEDFCISIYSMGPCIDRYSFRKQKNPYMILVFHDKDGSINKIARISLLLPLYVSHMISSSTEWFLNDEELAMLMLTLSKDNNYIWKSIIDDYNYMVDNELVFSKYYNKLSMLTPIPDYTLLNDHMIYIQPLPI